MSVVIGTASCKSAKTLLLLGSGELGKEVIIEAQRLGLETVAVDRYAGAPAMHVAHRSHVVDMLDAAALRAVIETEKPDFIVPEIEAIATDELLRLEAEGYNVIPSARAANLTMNREGIRRLAAEELGLQTSKYEFAAYYDAFVAAVQRVGMPCVIKPIMSSSGKGQSVVQTEADIDTAWAYAQEGGRAGAGKVIVEAFVDFDYEITLLYVQHVDGGTACEPIGHRQQAGDYRESWQPQPMSALALERATTMAEQVTSALGGWGLFGCEFFVNGDEVWFSEVSPRPHDTGMVTLISQDLSEFALHVRAIMGLPIAGVHQYGAAASTALLLEGCSTDPTFTLEPEALRSSQPVNFRLFGKPAIDGGRRMGVALALGDDVAQARSAANRVAAAIKLAN